MGIIWPTILVQQRKWAASHGISRLNSNYTRTVEDNLFQPLTEAARADYTAGRGNELGGAMKPGKMQALHSSSALVCNVFDYWRGRLLLGQSADPLAAALGAPTPLGQIGFEKTYRTGLGGNPPTLDVVLQADRAKPFLIESKFTENHTHSAEDAFKRSYFPDSGELWGKLGMPRCEELARRISADQEKFCWLNAPQLLKHILGVATAYGKEFTLLYLWYATPTMPQNAVSHGAAEHRAEIETFMLRLNGEIDFRAMTYQELFKKMQSTPDVDRNYITYLSERYFPG